MKNEDFRVIGLHGSAGCTAEQLEYNSERSRAIEIFRGRIDRPWASLGFKAKPVPATIGRNGPVQPLTKQTRFVHPEAVDVVSMTRRPSNYRGPHRSAAVCFQVLVQTGYTDQGGQPCVGGNPAHLKKELDFARNPLQDHQCFLIVDHIGDLKHPGEAGRFEAARSDLWLDLCVGRLPNSSQPMAIFRIAREHEESGDVEVVAGGQVKIGDTLAVIKKSIRLGQARFDEHGPLVNRIGREVLCAKRLEADRASINPFFQMLNQMNRQLNDMVLVAEAERGAILPLSAWAPRVMVVIPDELASRLTSLEGYSHTEYLRDQAREAIGPDGDYYVRAKHSGVLEKIEPSRRQNHLLRIAISGQAQSIPASAILLDELDIGATVAAGDPIAHVCRRIYFNSWQDVESMMGIDANDQPIEAVNANWWLLPSFLQEQMIRPGQQGWNGPGVLIDLRYLSPGMLRPEWPWVFDFEPSLPYLDERGGYIVGPPFTHRDWNDIAVSVNGLVYVMEGANEDIRDRGGRKTRRNRRKSRQIDAGVTGNSHAVRSFEPPQAESNPTPETAAHVNAAL